MENFIVGTNYWASHAGTRMWSDWDEEVVRKDLLFLNKNGIKTIRVFPLWSDFQPVKPVFSGGAYIYEYRMENDELPKNTYYLDESMICKFERFLELCKENSINVIVALLTGFMSGRLFVPSALYEKNLYTDSVALMFEQKFIKGFVSHFINNKEIVAWDIGNECNCMMSVESRAAAFSWLSMISNAIRAIDNNRPVVSGMDRLTLEGEWTIQDQTECIDIFTTHPYPYWVNFGSSNLITDIKTLLLPTAMNKLHSDIGKKTSMVEEIGTMGPMICDDNISAQFANVNLFSTWANGASGMMWWCAFDQKHLNHAPYVWNKCEVELGMAGSNYSTKPVLEKFKSFYDFLTDSAIELPMAKENGTIILTKGQEQWGIGWMSYVLAKMSGVNVNFAYADYNIPDSKVYLLPSVSGHILMNKDKLDLLMSRVYDGAKIYISNDNGIISEFTKYTGLTVKDSLKVTQTGSFEFQNREIPFSREYKYCIETNGANVLCTENGTPMFTKYIYGEGEVYYLNYPLEKNMLNNFESPENNEVLIYKQIFEETKHILTINNRFLGVTEHMTPTGAFVVIVNYSENEYKLEFNLSDDYLINKCLFGQIDVIEPFGCVVLCLEKK